MHTLLLTYVLAYLLTYLCIYLLHTRVKTVLLCKTVYTPLLSMTQTLIVFLRTGQVVYTHAHMHTYTHLHCTDIRITVFIDKECLSLHVKQTKCTYTHLNSRCLLTYLLTCSASNYLLHTKGKTMTPNKKCLHSMHTDEDFALLTYLLCYVFIIIITEIFRVF